MEHAASGEWAERAGGALAEADHRLAGCGALLEQQVALGPCRLLDDRTVAQVRALAADIAAQLAGPDPALVEQVRDMLAARRAVLTHLHALAVEHRLADTLAVERALDPTLPPLFRSHIDADDTVALIAAQSRMDAAMRRMHLPLGELPGDLQQLAWSISHVAHADHGQPEPPVRRADPDQPEGRLSLIHRVLSVLGDDVPLALRIDEAGVALFLSALAMASPCSRDAVVLATAEDHPIRLALILRAAGLSRKEAAVQLLAIRPDADPALVDVDGANADRLLRDALR